MAVNFKIVVDDRKYTHWKIYDYDDVNINEYDLTIDPLSSKLFSCDVFQYDNETFKTTIVHSPTRNVGSMPGILVLSDGKSYGHDKKKLLYKCIPDDIRLPVFLVPYQVKNNFTKKLNNQYVLFHYEHWNDKHPRGILDNNIGSVSELANYYEYQLHCKSLYASLQNFTKEATMKARMRGVEEMMDKIVESNSTILDRRLEKIITIDSESTSDYDDAISFVEGENGIKRISIYISNVPLWMDELELWNSFSERVSTIYLPDRKRPMMPTILSENLCSLREKEEKFAFVMDVYLNDKSGDIDKVEFHNARIKVRKNHVYNSEVLLKDKMYNKIYHHVVGLHDYHKYIKQIHNSTDVITYLMILMNSITANKLIEYNSGIYRSLQIIERNKMGPSHDHLPNDISSFMKNWNSGVGSYTLYDNRKPHDLMEIESYIHITSPIRRLVDLLNMMKLQEFIGSYKYSCEAGNFYDKWVGNIDYINKTMRSIRKVQIDCNMLDLFTNKEIITQTIYDGYVFDKIERDDGTFQYNVYLHDMKIVSRITLRDERENYEKMQFKIYLFEDQETLRKKIRLQPL
jgi:exoribonuclease R